MYRTAEGDALKVSELKVTLVTSLRRKIHDTCN